MRCLASLCALLVMSLHLADAFKWTVDERMLFEEPVIVSEGYMFATNRGPLLMSQGDSYIDVSLAVQSTYAASPSLSFSLLLANGTQ